MENTTNMQLFHTVSPSPDQFPMDSTVSNSPMETVAKNVSNTTSGSTIPEPFFTDFPIDRVALVFYPIIFAVGVTGNILSLLVMQRKWINHLSVSFLLSALACSDIGVLVCAFTFRWLTNSIIPLDLADLNSVACKFALYTNLGFLTCSAWIIVAVTADRVITIYLPLKAKLYCTRSRAKIGILCIVFLIFGTFSYMFWFWHSYGGECTLKPEFRQTGTTILIFIHTALFPGIPCVCLFVMNLMIVVKTIHLNRTRVGLGVSKKTVSKSTRRVTFLVLMTSITYFILTVPMGVMYSLSVSMSPAEDTWAVVDSTQYTLRTLSDFLMTINSSVNFFVYVISGEKFRRETINMFRECCGLKIERTDISIFQSRYDDTVDDNGGTYVPPTPKANRQLDRSKASTDNEEQS